MKYAKHYVVSLLALVAIAGCQETAPKYRWGIYENHLHRNYVHGSETNPLQSARNLHKDINGTLETGDIVPPGQYAHLGFLYYQANEISMAIDFLNKEKSDYPESAAFVDTLLKNIQAKQQ